MIKRLLLYLVAAALLLAVAVSADQWDEDHALLQEHALNLSADIEKQIGDAQNWLNVNPLSVLKNASSDTKAQTSIAEQAEKDYTLIHLRGDGIDFWTNTKALPDIAQLSGLTTAKTVSLLKLPYGDFVFYNLWNHHDWCLIAPIGYGINRAFSSGGGIPGKIVVGSTPTDYPIQVGGKNIGFIRTETALFATWLSWFKLVFLGLFVVVLLALFSKGANWLSQRYSPPAGAVAVALAAMLLVIINKFTGATTGLLGALPAFSEYFTTPSLLGNTLGDWLIGIGLFAWAAQFFFRYFRFQQLSEKGQNVRLGIALGAYSGIMFTSLAGAALLSHLVFNSDINFDFDNLLNLNGLALLAVAGILVWWLGAFLLGHRLARLVRACELPFRHRGVAIGGSFAITLGLAFVLAVPLNAFYLAGFGLLYAIAFDYFVHDNKAGNGWAVAWLLLLSLFSGLLLYRLNFQEDRTRRMAYAQTLATDRDEDMAEQGLLEWYKSLSADSVRLGELLKPFPFKADAEAVQTWLNQKYFPYAYLFQNYRLYVLAFDPSGQPLLKDQIQTHQQAVQNDWANGKPLANQDQLRYGFDAEGKFHYMVRLPVHRMGDQSQPADLYCFLNQEFAKATRVYARLFYQKPYKGLEGLNRYDFAIQRNGKLVAERGQNGLLALANEAGNGQTIDVERSEQGRLDAVSRSADGKTAAVVGRSGGDWYKPLYLFAVLFSLAAFFVIFIGFLNRWLHFLPIPYELFFKANGSLAQRIHSSNITLIAGAFALISLMAYLQFSRNAIENEQINVDSRSEAMLAMLRAQTLGSSLSTDSLRRNLPAQLNTLAGSFGMDANLYSPDGDLLFSTQPDLRQAGVISGKMSMTALIALKDKLTPSLTEKEYLGGIPFSTKYFTLRDGENRQLGYLGIPYDLSGQTTNSAASDFLGLLASLFVFLLITAFAVSFLLSQSITKPLSLISEKIRRLRLDNKNEPLEYAGDAQDEVSALILQYNDMVEKLEDSKVKLVKLERESAWREMARQVAHDIKNPLTTMKLSMQQLDRLSGNPEQAAAYLRKAITRLIEQIDSLAQIASEFSMFANLDIREKPPMELNNVVESVYDLFSEQQNVSLELKMPDELFIINGDKNHLIRVFNNLVINAIQAVPSDRKGHIIVSLGRKDNLAVVRINDNAGGIPPEIRERVFEPNFTTKTSGSGLGLAICRKIVESHDGEIYFETRDNDGTDFFVELPIEKVEKVKSQNIAASFLNQ